MLKADKNPFSSKPSFMAFPTQLLRMGFKQKKKTYVGQMKIFILDYGF